MIAHVTSADGTTIGYRRIGSGPGLVISHGGMGSGHNHLEQARALADTFTVYLPDRRGRGLSGPFGDGYGVRQDAEDLAAVIAATGARYLFGLSVGGASALAAALTVPAVEKLAVYEPALSTAPLGWVPRFTAELDRGRTAAALVTAMKGAQMGPPLLRAAPRPLLELGTYLGLRSEDRRGSGEYEPMRVLAEALRHETRILAEMNGRLGDFRALRTEVLLLGGAKSPAYQKAALSALERVLPHATRVELPGVGHEAPWNAGRGGSPERVAAAMRPFFTA